MRTFSHAILGTVVADRFRPSRGELIAAALGSVAPDLPLLLLSGWTLLTSPTSEEGHARIHEAYATDPLWIASHNTLHSVVVLGVLALLGWAALRWRRRLGGWLLWFVAGAALHAGIDIITHATDGPRFLFPLSWEVRFESPISYWDPAYFGRLFTVVEISLDFVLVSILGWAGWRRRQRSQKGETR